jgi:hypothetical protein
MTEVTMSTQVTDDVVSAVLSALAKPEFKWRTIAGVTAETGLPRESVIRALAAASDKVVRSSVPSADGQDLYTTRQHFRENASLSEKLRGAFKNRAE